MKFILTRAFLLIGALGVFLPHFLCAQEQGECTLGVVMPGYTSDGRMLIWKNRDVTNRNQAVHQGVGPTGIRYVGIGYAHEGDIVHSGVNDAGFAIVESNAYNLGGGRPGPDDDGEIMTVALKTCTTIAQFRLIMDSTNTASGGRSRPSEYIVFDSSGSAAVYDAGRYVYYEHIVNPTTPYEVRANYGLFGTPQPTSDSQWGYYRQRRADTLFRNQLTYGTFRVDSLFAISRDLAQEGWNPLRFAYPDSGMDLDIRGSICRSISISAVVIQGGKYTANGWLPPVCWCFLGKQIATMAVPVWPHQTSLSSLLTDFEYPTSLINDRSNSLFDAAAPNPSLLGTDRLNWFYLPILDTERVRVPQILPLLESRLTAAEAKTASDTMAAVAYSTLMAIPLNPTYPINLTLSQPVGNENWTIGHDHLISWTSQRLTGDFRIELNRTFPTGTWEPIATVAYGSSPLQWTVSGAATNRARIRITSVSTPVFTDSSDADFSIGVDWAQNQSDNSGPGNLTAWIPNLPTDANTGWEVPASFFFPALVTGSNPSSIFVRYNSRAVAVLVWGLDSNELSGVLPANTSINRFWEINTTGGFGMNATVMLRFTAAQLPAGITNPVAQITVAYHKHGAGAWMSSPCIVAGPDGSGVYTATINGVSTFSYWGLGSSEVLPVELTSFTAVAGDNRINLAWRVESETQNRSFRIYRSELISENGSVQAEINGRGTTSQAHTYRWTDTRVQNGRTYYYRLSDVSLDGSETMHPGIVTATPRPLGVNVPLEYALSQNIPNPFNPVTTITYTLKAAGVVDLRVYDIASNEVAVLTHQAQGIGAHNVTFDGSRLPSGIYFYRLQVNKFVAIKKMVLVK